MLNKKLLWIAAIVVSGILLTAEYNRPFRWWPINDMSEQEFIKPFTEDSLRTPPEGSVAVGAWDPVPSKVDVLTDNAPNLKNPQEATPESIAQGEALYNTYCWQCHGREMSPDPAKQSPVQKGEGFGRTWSPVFSAMNIQIVKNYSDEHIYSVISNGTGAIMKRQSYHLSPEERWHVVNYIRSLANKN